jgi:hypothetical protein
MAQFVPPHDRDIDEHQKDLLREMGLYIYIYIYIYMV